MGLPTPTPLAPRLSRLRRFHLGAFGGPTRACGARSLGASSFSEVWLRPGDYVLVLELGVRVIVGFRVMVRSVLIQDVPQLLPEKRHTKRSSSGSDATAPADYAAMMMMMLWSELETPRVGNAWVRKCKGTKCMET